MQVATTKEAMPITGAWPSGTLLVKVGAVANPAGSLPLRGRELPLSNYGALYDALSITLGTALPKTNGLGYPGTTHFLLPNYRYGMISIPGEMGMTFGGAMIHLPGRDYSIEWLVVV